MGLGEAQLIDHSNDKVVGSVPSSLLSTFVQLCHMSFVLLMVQQVLETIPGQYITNFLLSNYIIYICNIFVSSLAVDFFHLVSWKNAQ